MARNCLISLLYSIFLLCFTSRAKASNASSEAPQIPSFVIDYAPLVYLDVNEVYLPSDIGKQLLHTTPMLNFTKVENNCSSLTLDNLSCVNQINNCSYHHFYGCAVYLTTIAEEFNHPPFFHGVMPNQTTGKTQGARSSAIIVTDHLDGTVDAFYMFFYAFNLGDKPYVQFFGGHHLNLPLASFLGDHVGDWEHVMIRFVHGQPRTMWFSQHSSGKVFSYDSLHKKKGRPQVFAARGSHANYPHAGLHSRGFGPAKVLQVSDHTSAGYLWDPTLSAYYYTFKPQDVTNASYNAGTFIAAEANNLADGSSSSDAPTDWLKYFGHWGNKGLPNSNSHQFHYKNLVYRWADGPSGPYGKDLNRNKTCPDGITPCPTTTKLSAVTGNPCPAMTIPPPTITGVADANLTVCGAKVKGSAHSQFKFGYHYLAVAVGLFCYLL